ncbi:pyruvate ferredoxin oxidoreductase subunit beta [Desulfomarina profundi]|uniref:Pyruvate ferredoxin oxidoreductase subunit beta n=1 Tax=Desulfomarina profundi TaxID=2772557 RepID=A0A8D5FHX6_9BACT|nr:thiamine pyrophosphate-dependent enzyme [Desulfomarina profundi]BCL61663.1 pyruvate ferredoxin oxidoreductase subunit beta [Desulfomarina profundi]
MEKKTTTVNLTEEEFVHPGNRACSGCGLSIVYRMGLKALGKNTILVVPPSCLTVLQGLYPVASSKLPVVNVTFASTGAAATGVRGAMKALKKTDVNVVAWAGDGGTSDIGIQALSGACERGEDIIYICYDNEAYMNTGVQRSGTTPQGVLTTTTPIKGKLQKKKDVPSIIAAHGIGYVATASAAFPLDFYDKVKKATTLPGPKYIHVHTPCPPGWSFESRYTIKIGKLAVQTGLFDLYEIENGQFRLTGASEKLIGQKRKPVTDYFATQGRFKSLDKELVAGVQEQIDAKWANY